MLAYVKTAIYFSFTNLNYEKIYVGSFLTAILFHVSAG